MTFANSKRALITNAVGLIFLVLQVVPAHAVTTAPVEVTCPLTGKVFTTRVFRSFTVRGYRLDSRPVLAGSPQILPLPVCPDFGFPVYRDFSAEELQEIRKIVRDAEFIKVVEIGNTHHAAAFVEERLGSSAAFLATLYLQAYWEAEDYERGPRMSYGIRSLAHFRAYLVGASTQDDDWWNAQIISANLERKLGQFHEAINRLESLPVENLPEGSRTLTAIEQTLFHARNGDPEAKELKRSQISGKTPSTRQCPPDYIEDMSTDTCVPDTRSGSGFFINNDGYIVTNAHVGEGCRYLKAHFDAKTYSAIMVERNKSKDLAIVKISHKNLNHATFYPNLTIKSGAKIVAVGYPLRGLLATEPHVFLGAITATKGLFDNPNHFQVSTPIQPGNSGGPVLDLSGNVIGVIVATIDTIEVAQMIGSIPQNVNFAISANTLINYLDSINIDYTEKGSTLSIAHSLVNSEEDVAKDAKRYTVALECTAN